MAESSVQSADDPEWATVHVGIVVIGRNEGERLARCFDSLKSQVGNSTRSGKRVRAISVYIDSGSSDNSVTIAQQHDIPVVHLSSVGGFTAAKARMAGVEWLRESGVDLRYVQFLDGDCSLDPDWIIAAINHLECAMQTGVVCGRLKELRPEHSVFNRLCDLEWDGPTGTVKACGGIAMMRWSVLEQTGGFRQDLIAGEEPELCVRIRTLGWRVERLPRLMGFHDANMTRPSQWWRRSMRGGFAAAQGMWLHGTAPERLGVDQTQSALLWGLLIPLAIALCVILWGGWGSLLLSVYPLQFARMVHRDRHGLSDSLVKSLFLMLGKFPAMMGAGKFWWSRLNGKAVALIEHK